MKKNIWSFFYCNMENYYKCRHLLFRGSVDLGSHDQNECVGLAESSSGLGSSFKLIQLF